MFTYSQPSFSSSVPQTYFSHSQTIGVISQERFTIEVKLLLNFNSKSYMPRRLVQVQQRVTLSDLEWSFHPHRALSLQ